jgi:hypothetical protein
MENIDWPCAWSKGGRDPELADGCDRPAQLFALETGLWYCPDHLPDSEVRITRYAYLGDDVV